MPAQAARSSDRIRVLPGLAAVLDQPSCTRLSPLRCTSFHSAAVARSFSRVKEEAHSRSKQLTSLRNFRRWLFTWMLALHQSGASSSSDSLVTRTINPWNQLTFDLFDLHRMDECCRVRRVYTSILRALKIRQKV